MVRFVFLFICSFLLYSCSEESIPNNPLLHFPEDITDKISPSKVLNLEKYEVFKPEAVLKYLDGYIVKSQVRENMITYIDIVNNKTICGINQGDAPEDLVNPSSFQKMKDDLFIYDIVKKRVYKVDLLLNDSTISLSEYKSFNMEERPFIVHLLDSGIIASGIFSDMWIAGFSDAGNTLSSLEFPDFESNHNFTNIDLSTVYLSTLIAVNPNEQKVICATQKGGFLAFANLSVEGMREYKRVNYYAPMVKKVSDRIAFDRNNKVGFCGVACSDNYVFALYSGRTFNTHGLLSHYCEHVLVYDWQGKPVKHLILDKPLFSMNYDAQSNKLYGVGYDPEGCILEYDLEGVI